MFPSHIKKEDEEGSKSKDEEISIGTWHTWDWSDQGTCPQDKENIENIRTDDICDSDIRVFFVSGYC